MDNVVTSVLVFEDNQTIQHYAGGYSDWLKRGKRLADRDSPASDEAEPTETATAPAPGGKVQKLSYKLQREYDQLPDMIEGLEQQITDLQTQTSAPDFYTRPYTDIQPVLDELEARRQQLDDCMQRWLELDGMLP
ncbi:MAG: hypothetical protein ACR2P9_03320 [Gammaproteobacteria bacterium]